MRFRELAATAIAAMAVAGAALPASAESSGYTIAPAGRADPRNNYVPQSGAVFIVDNAKGVISMCFPDNKDNKVVIARRRPSCPDQGLPPGIPEGVLSWITCAARSRISSS